MISNPLIHHLHEQYQCQPWKNGGGSTLEIAKQQSAQDDKFAWRISIATLDTDGLYSSFPGVKRTQVMLSGKGVTLTIDDSQQREVSLKPLEQCSFSGEALVNCQLEAAQSASMFNIMSACGHDHQVQVCPVDQIKTADLSGDYLLIFAVDGPVDVTVDEQRLQLRTRDMLQIDGAHTRTLSVKSASDDLATQVILVKIISN